MGIWGGGRAVGGRGGVGGQGGWESRCAHEKMELPESKAGLAVVKRYDEWSGKGSRGVES